jgi:ABC-type transporter Mla MlaB component
MKIKMSGLMASLAGDWTVAGVTQGNLDTLALSLQQIEPGSAGRLQIDCRDVSAIDTIGQQILSVWLQCARLRGVEPELLNPPDELRQAFQGFGLPCRYTLRYTARHNHAAPNDWKRRFPHENRRDKGNSQATSH